MTKRTAKHSGNLETLLKSKSNTRNARPTIWGIYDKTRVCRVGKVRRDRRNENKRTFYILNTCDDGKSRKALDTNNNQKH